MKEPSYYVGKPVRSLQTILRVLSKTRNNQTSVIPDGIYGENTVKAVKEFQRQENLNATGVTDNETWNKVANAYLRESPLVLPAAPLEIIWNPKTVIIPGETSLHLYIIQSMLLALQNIFPEIPKLQVTGIHDNNSVNSIKWLQKTCGFVDSGIITQVEWLFLTKMYRLFSGDGKNYKK